MSFSFYLSLVSHFLMGFYFVFFGIWNIYHSVKIVKTMIQEQIPMPYFFLPLGITWQLIFGCMLMFNSYVKLSALMLIPFTIVSVFMFHPFWKYTGEKLTLNLTIFVLNLTITVGGLLLIVSPVTSFTDFIY